MPIGTTVRKLETQIAIAAPVRGMQIVQAVRRTGGEFVLVSEEEIWQSLKELTGQGYYIEPTSAATTAGVEKYLAGRPKEELVVSVFTGHGLKATEKLVHLRA